MKSADGPVRYENLRDIVFHAGEQFPYTHFFLSNDHYK